MQIHRMNSSASTLLHSLSTVGVRSVRFRILSQNDITKHTTPVAVLDEEGADGPGHRMPRFSILELFNAYSLTPRKGDYTLEVDHGQLSFTPLTSSSPAKTRESAVKQPWKPKISQRHVRNKLDRSRKFPSA
jgi:hypothetical protein